MCTITIVPKDDGFRLLCNRDERRGRPPAIPPHICCLRDRATIFPVDPVGGGTWVGVNDAGVAAALLNRTVDTAVRIARRPLRSRGLIIPALFGCGSLAEALKVTAVLDPTHFYLFRLVVVQTNTVAVVTSNGFALSIEVNDFSRPLMLTSSSLGDAVVEPPRRRLFEQLVVEKEGAWLRAQARFHLHRWRSHADISVTMERPDARTVSRTLIDVSSRAIELCYRSTADPAAGAPSQVNLAVSAGSIYRGRRCGTGEIVGRRYRGVRVVGSSTSQPT
jgi:hypothetical protein